MPPSFDMVCLSHLRWDFVYQRPQHLMSRCSRQRRVFFLEEPVFDEDTPRLDVTTRGDNLLVVVPHVPESSRTQGLDSIQRRLFDDFWAERCLRDYVLWYYTPLAVPFTRHFQPLVTVYDCMDELAAFAKAPARITQLEAELLDMADLVFTGGQSLYEAKRERHPRVTAYPSGVDYAHFACARESLQEPVDQASIPHPRLGFYGVIDERIDLELLADVADAQPEWHLVVVGPVLKIDPSDLPQRQNIHYLGQKAYADLPKYLAGWDVALMPFARNESTRFISPTKTPEYLAAGRPVVSTSIRDVIQPYGERGLVHIADSPVDFVSAIRAAMREDPAARLRAADALLSEMSWDRTWAEMSRLVETEVAVRQVKNQMGAAIGSMKGSAVSDGHAAELPAGAARRSRAVS